MVGTCRSHIWPHKRPLSSLTFWLVLDQLFHLALFQCVYHIRQAALASLRGSKGAHDWAAVAAGPSSTSAFLFAWWGSIVLGIRTQGAPLAILLLEKGRRGNIIRFKDYLTFKTEKIKCEGGKKWGGGGGGVGMGPLSIPILSPFILSISPSESSLQPTVIHSQISQVRAYFFFFFLSHPLESAFDWLGGTWQKEHMKQQQKGSAHSQSQANSSLQSLLRRVFEGRPTPWYKTPKFPRSATFVQRVVTINAEDAIPPRTKIRKKYIPFWETKLWSGVKSFP